MKTVWILSSSHVGKRKLRHRISLMYHGNCRIYFKKIEDFSLGLESLPLLAVKDLFAQKEETDFYIFLKPKELLKLLYFLTELKDAGANYTVILRPERRRKYLLDTGKLEKYLERRVLWEDKFYHGKALLPSYLKEETFQVQREREEILKEAVCFMKENTSLKKDMPYFYLSLLEENRFFYETVWEFLPYDRLQLLECYMAGEIFLKEKEITPEQFFKLNRSRKVYLKNKILEEVRYQADSPRFLKNKKGPFLKRVIGLLIKKGSYLQNNTRMHK